MDSQPPPSRPRSLRPWYLVAAMLLTWVLGVWGFLGGCGAAMYLREGAAPDVMALVQEAHDHGKTYQLVFLAPEAAQLRAMSDHQEIAFPLSIARMILGGLLVIASSFALGGRPGARGLALQALAASLVFAVLDYVLSREVRGAWIDTVVRAGAALPLGSPARQALTDADFWWIWERVRLAVFELAVLALAAVALTRGRASAWFDAAARAAESTEEP